MERQPRIIAVTANVQARQTGKTFNGKVSFISPALDHETRTLKIRLEIPNGGLLLKLDMYADAKLGYSLGNRLAVPEAAVMRTGVMVAEARHRGPVSSESGGIATV